MSDITIPPEALEAAARERWKMLKGQLGPAFPRLAWEALSEQKRAELLVEERAACLAMLRAWPKMHTGPAPTAEIARLRAENERLRAALEGYVCTCTGGECAEQAGYRDECGKPARAALEETKHE